MTKAKQLDPIPEEFSTYEQAGEFWDTHDTTEYSGIFQTVERGKRGRVHPGGYWKSPSALKLAGDRDPIEVIVEKAQDLVFKAIEEGWNGPPFDPFQLARIRGIRVV